VRDHAALADTDELGVRAYADAEDAVTDLELGDGCADGFDLAGELAADDPESLLRPANVSGPRKPVSVRFTDVAWTLTRTSFSFGSGRSTSSSRRTSGGPYLS
jgi:hypothetical protein